MWIKLAIFDSLLLLILLVLLFRTRGVIRGQIYAARNKRAYLAEPFSWFQRFLGLDQLNEISNSLVRQNQSLSVAENNYLRHIESTLGRMREAVLIINEQNQLISANAAAVALLSLSSGRDKQRIESILKSSTLIEYLNSIRHGRTRERQEFVLEKDGQNQWFEVSGTLVPSFQEGEGELTLFVLHDITRLKRLEGMRKEFVANVSHELRTPTTIIKGFTDTLLSDHAKLSDEKREKFLLKIHKNVERFHLLLEDLLTLSRLETTEVSINQTPMSLPRTINEILDIYRERLGERADMLETEFEEGIDIVPVDAVKFPQIIRNLVDNAIRYAKGATYIRVFIRDEGNGTVRIGVIDDGCGIPSQDVPHIFERFYRVDKGRSRESGGTGLGLSIVKHIVQMHGGEVFVKSDIGQGTCIHFTLPRNSDALRQMKPQLAPNSARQADSKA